MSHSLSTSPPFPRWTVKPQAPRHYVEASGQSELVAQLLYNRDVPLDDVPGYLNPDLYVTKSPFLLKDMGRAVERIWKALTLGETIGVFGDFDVDGVTSTIVIAEALRMLGGKVFTYIPNRFEQGHGLDAGGVTFAAQAHGDDAARCLQRAALWRSSALGGGTNQQFQQDQDGDSADSHARGHGEVFGTHTTPPAGQGIGRQR